MAEQPVVVSATIVDAWGIEASTAFYAQADDTQTVAALLVDAGNFYRALDATTDGYIKKVRIELLPVLGTGGITGLATSPSGTSRVEQTGLLGFSATGSTKRYTAAIPALSDGATVLVGDRIVLTAIDPVGVLIGLLTAAATVLKWCNEHNQQIAAFIDALVAFRKKRKQLQRSSFEVPS